MSFPFPLHPTHEIRADIDTFKLARQREEDVRTPDIELPVLARAVRSVPGNGGLWLEYLRALVSTRYFFYFEVRNIAQQHVLTIRRMIRSFMTRRITCLVRSSPLSSPENGSLTRLHVRVIDVYQLALSSGRLSGPAIADIAIPAVLPTYRLLRSGMPTFRTFLLSVLSPYNSCKTANAGLGFVLM